MLVKFWHALGRRGKRMREGDALGIVGELAWLGGWLVGAADWLLRPRRLGQRFARSSDGSRGW
jgi:hypothetical protein